ncbi:TIGR04282 family arsenosugar biosynthesis glycosyltransferase [Haloechinothrix halophila]|uniref:TIGR04282 family arsenosugar biosynthesis glycosyltransferase n=1 Tax=Haloechinothrix halophila TaxID=1069073 RepID=UPI000555314C|nr:DUF2064 domain-containing protein [Haloechinothrix halophila]
MAKAPIPGFAKTRLCPPATPTQAALLAAACLLDTLDAARATGAPVVVALAGNADRIMATDGVLSDGGMASDRVPIADGDMPADGDLAADVRQALRRVDVIPQHGIGLGERLANAHADAARLHPGAPVLQIGMDTPQVTTHGLAAALALLEARAPDVVSPTHDVVFPAQGAVCHADGDSRVDAVLGAATDGGWWALGLRDPAHAAALTGVPMSTSETGDRTRDALHARGLRIADLPVLSDVDTMADAVRVAPDAPKSRFAQALGDVLAVRGAPERMGLRA